MTDTDDDAIRQLIEAARKRAEQIGDPALRQWVYDAFMACAVVLADLIDKDALPELPDGLPDAEVVTRLVSQDSQTAHQRSVP